MPAADVIPMPTARMGQGRYEVIGTSNPVEVVRRRREWWIVIDGNEDARVGPFPTKRAACQFCQAHPEV